MPIAQHSVGKKFQNPYRIEEKLLTIYKSNYNVSIELVVDACREHNTFVQRFKDINLEVP
jgi:hypothetical protein